MNIPLFNIQMNMPLFNILSLSLLISSIIPPCFAAVNEQFSSCSRRYSCGSIANLPYPFWGGQRPSFCGQNEFQLSCPPPNQYPVLSASSSRSASFTVLRADRQKATIVYTDLLPSICNIRLPNSTVRRMDIVVPGFLSFAELVSRIQIFYGCGSNVTSSTRVKRNVPCLIRGVVDTGVVFADEAASDVQGCRASVVAPVKSRVVDELWSGRMALQEVVNLGIDVQYADISTCLACEDSGGTCGSNSSEFSCFCRNAPSPTVCAYHGKKRLLRKIAFGISAAGIGLFICFAILLYRKRSVILTWGSVFTLPRKEKNHNLEILLRQNGSLAPKRFSYMDIKKFTNSFRDKLGQGGYGSVFKGAFPDGSLVAVKVLTESKGNGEDFVNEIASITRTCHVNVVGLLGFCIDGARRALVYEFMPNGSLDRYIHGVNSNNIKCLLGWEKLYEIALGIAQGLEYLHRGCSTRILHLDIKPHNILLDQDFCPKIADFGLAKLGNRTDSVISTLEARGTIGYIAPEVISRNFGRVSYKSDVYSYGMMVLEMVGGRRNLELEARHSSKVYYPQWLYQRIIRHEDLELQGAKTENETGRKMILVGLWCIQTDPTQRPSMSKVINMLENSLESIEIPPKPFFGSPNSSAGSEDWMNLQGCMNLEESI